MKKIFLSIITLIITHCSFAQFTTSGSDIYYNSGKVGIGTTSPQDPLHIFKVNDHQLALDASGQFSTLDFFNNGALKSQIYWDNTYSTLNLQGAKLVLQPVGGNVGIGTTSPQALLDISTPYTSIRLSSPSINENYLTFRGTPDGSGYHHAKIFTGRDATTYSYGSYMAFFTEGKNSGTTDASTEKMRITPSGNVLINQTTQTNPAYKLDINGDARAKKIVVNTDGADFVFEPEYTLPKLFEVKTYIDQNHHLPEIPSAAAMQKNGMDVGELNTKLLQKVEELTLYLIEQQKQLDELKNQVAKLHKEN